MSCERFMCRQAQGNIIEHPKQKLVANKSGVRGERVKLLVDGEERCKLMRNKLQRRTV